MKRFPLRLVLSLTLILLICLSAIGVSIVAAHTARSTTISLGFQLMYKIYGTHILASETTRTQAGDTFAWKEIDRIIVKGRSQAVVIYEPLGLSGKITEPLIQNRDQYETGLARYRNRDFQEAITRFENAARFVDSPTAEETMIARCRQFLLSPPPPHWDGAFLAE